jgi:predicted GNAT family acetyltransferase
VRRELLRGETPLLHVMSANVGARALYARIGFREVSEVSVRVVSRL